jgi:hypothetical protein
MVPQPSTTITQEDPSLATASMTLVRAGVRRRATTSSTHWSTGRSAPPALVIAIAHPMIARLPNPSHHQPVLPTRRGSGGGSPAGRRRHRPRATPALRRLGPSRSGTRGRDADPGSMLLLPCGPIVTSLPTTTPPTALAAPRSHGAARRASERSAPDAVMCSLTAVRPLGRARATDKMLVRRSVQVHRTPTRKTSSQRGTPLRPG